MLGSPRGHCLSPFKNICNRCFLLPRQPRAAENSAAMLSHSGRCLLKLQLRLVAHFEGAGWQVATIELQRSAARALAAAIKKIRTDDAIESRRVGRAAGEDVVKLRDRSLAKSAPSGDSPSAARQSTFRQIPGSQPAPNIYGVFRMVAAAASATMACVEQAGERRNAVLQRCRRTS